MKSIIIGKGEIGRSLLNVLSKEYDLWVVDKDQSVDEKEFDIMHVCFPYSGDFVGEVQRYQGIYTPKYTIVHSTVPPETYESINAISSPCLGIHPHLEESLTTFTKFLAGKGASDVADYFRRAGFKVYVLDNPKSTALMKILDTTFYAVCVEYTKDVKDQCDKYGVPFELWTLWTNNYNNGYKKLGYEEYTRPNLTPVMKRQGGHCTIPNCDLLDTEFTRFVKQKNA